MSLRYEQYRALKMTREFLRYVMTELRTPVKIKDLRERAYRCVRHYPFLTGEGVPMWSQDPFTCDKCGVSTSNNHKCEEEPIDPNTAEALKDKYGYWGEHPDHAHADWVQEIANNNDRDGYWDWVENQIEQSKEADERD